MSDNILGQRFITRERPAWHNLGTIFPRDRVITASEAMIEVAGDVKASPYPLYYEIDGTRYRADKLVAIVRNKLPDDDQFRILGVTSDSWNALSYGKLAEALDPLSKTFKVETAGILNRGGLAFICFRAEDWDVRGDEMRSYLCSNMSLTPGIGHSFFHSAIRVVCWNTNTTAKRQATINLRIPHDSDVLAKMELASRLVTQFVSVRNKTKEIFESFADTMIGSKDVENIFRAAFPDPALPTKLRLLKDQLSRDEAEVFKQSLTADLLRGLEKAQSDYDRGIETARILRETALERFERFDPPRLRGTAWGAYNAVTEVSDWRDGRNADQSALFGSRAQEKSRAFVKTLEIVKN